MMKKLKGKIDMKKHNGLIFNSEICQRKVI